MATGTIVFDAATYAPGGEGGDRALVTITEWAGALPIEGAVDRFYQVTTDSDLTVILDETTGAFCYRIVVERPALLSEEVRFVSFDGSLDVPYADLVDVDPTTFEPATVTPTLTEYILQLIADNPAVVDPGELAATVEAYLLANPTEIADVAGLAAALAGKAATSHVHAIGDVTGLQPALDGKAATSHGHAIGDVTGLQTALDNAANVGIPTFFSASEPAPAGPLLWIKDLGSGAVSLALKTP